MKNENAKLLLGLGFGTLIGMAAGYLLTDEHRRKLEKKLSKIGHGIKEDVESAFYKMKSKAEQTGSESADDCQREAGDEDGKDEAKENQ